MTKPIVNTVTALAIALTAGSAGVLSLAGDAEAKKTTKWEYINKDKCYIAKKVPATVEYNTKGKLKHKASRVWVGNAQKHGAKVIDKHNDAVYFTTRTVIEDQHVTLVATKC